MLSYHEVESCLVRNLAHYTALDETSLRLIEGVEKERRQFQRGEFLQRRGGVAGDLYALRSGWVFASITDEEGRRQIIRVFFPGDVIGLAELSLGLAGCDLVAANDVEACPFPRKALEPVFATAPRLAAMLLSLSARDQSIYMDLIRAIGCLPAIERVGFMLLTWLSRLRITQGVDQMSMKCPMTQTEMGDLIGLTNVSISKALGSLEEQGFLTRDASVLTLARLDELVTATKYENRYGELDTSWFPRA